MTGITATEARSNLYRLIDEGAEFHQPIIIMGKRNKAARETGQPAFAALRCMATYTSIRILLKFNVANAGWRTATWQAFGFIAHSYGLAKSPSAESAPQ